MQTFLRYAVIASFFFALISLVILILKTFSFGRKLHHAQTPWKGRKGIMYAFTRGMMPWEKESTRKHLLSYVAGVFYHSGIFAAILYILSLIVPFTMSLYLISFLRVIMAAGVISGLSLFVKRLSLQHMKTISCLDDYAANILVDLVLIFTIAETFIQNVRSILFLMTMILFLYIPFGKIRHCFFFFYSRTLFGLFFGRRGVLPQKVSSKF